MKYGNLTATVTFKIFQVHLFRYQRKAHIRLPITVLYQVIAEIFFSDSGMPHLNALARRDFLSMSPYMVCRYKLRYFAYISEAINVAVSSITVHIFTLSASKATTKFVKITWYLPLLCPSRSSKVTEFGTKRQLQCDFLLVLTTTLLCILHRFSDTALSRFNMAIFGYSDIRIPLVFNSPDGGVTLERS